jgi:transcriptional regulator with XRE-family HTH domain
MPSLGQRLQRFRLESGWSKRRVADELGVSIPSIIRWEDELSLPNDYNRYKIEQLLASETGAVPAARVKRRMEQLRLFPGEVG